MITLVHDATHDVTRTDTLRISRALEHLNDLNAATFNFAKMRKAARLEGHCFDGSNNKTKPPHQLACLINRFAVRINILWPQLIVSINSWRLCKVASDLYSLDKCTYPSHHTICYVKQSDALNVMPKS